MGIKKLTDSEREVRRKNRNKKLFESYKTYNEGPRGSEESWRKTAELILSQNYSKEYLTALNLTEIPSSLGELTKAWKKTMLSAHPDKGGVNEKAVLANEAYQRLKTRYGIKTQPEQHIDLSDYITPAKADHIPHEDYELLWVDKTFINPNFIAEKKLDGSRYILYLDEESSLLSRRVSTVTKKYVDKTMNCPHLTRVPLPKEFWGTVLDGEMLHPKSEKSDDTTSIMGCAPEEAVLRQREQGWLRYCVYDIPKIGGVDIRNLPLKERLKKLKALVSKLSKHLPITLHPHFTSNDAKDLYHKIISKGGEGIMMKDINASYGHGWYKVKKIVTWDVVIMGYEAPKQKSKKVNGKISETYYHKEGLIGSVIFGAYKDGVLTELGTCSGMSESIRRTLSEKGKDYIGKVIEIKFQERTKSGAFRHARFIKFRVDKDASQCIDS